MSGLAYEHLHHNLKLLKLVTFESILGSSLFCVGKSGDQKIHIYEVIPKDHVHGQLIDINHLISWTSERL